MYFMKIGGLQKLSMVDYPGKMCATVFLRGCNLRCPFCHNASLVLIDRRNEELSEDDVLMYLKKRKGMLDCVCITGGEPLLHSDTAAFMRRIREIGYQIKLDTNGTFPDRLKAIIDEGLCDYVAMDIKNCPEKYAETCGLKEIFDTKCINESINILKNASVPYEFRTTVVKGLHTPEDILKIGEYLNGAPRYFLQQYRDSGDILGGTFEAFADSELQNMADSVKEFFTEVSVRGI